MLFEHEDAIRTILRRARIVKVDDSGTQQKVDLIGMSFDRPQKIVRALPHGFSSHPNADAEGVLLALGGRSDRLMFIGGEHKDHRQKNLKEGQAVLYDDQGNVVFAKGSQGLEVNAKTGEIAVYAQNEKVWVKPGPDKKVYLGGDGTDGIYARVSTEAGPAINVYAKVG